MAALSLTWTLPGAGWANCHIEDPHGQADIIASYISPAPEELISAVARLVLGATEQRVQFNAEPTIYRWIFNQDRRQVHIRVFALPDETFPDAAGTLAWTSRQPVDTLARATVRAFDQVEQEHGEAGYLEQWRSPFPRQELEALRTAWRAARHSTPD
jgi:hypothetical protein